MDLSEWIAESGLKREEIAKKLGVSRMTVFNLLEGRYRPSLNTALAVERLTKGKIKASSLARINTP